VFSRMQACASDNPSGTSANMPGYFVAMWQDSGGHPNSAVFVRMGGAQTANGSDTLYQWGTNTSGSSGTVAGSVTQVLAPFVRYHGSSGNYLVGYISGGLLPFVLNRNNGGNPDLWNGGPTPPTWGGLALSSGSSGFARTPNLISISFVRYIAGNGWLAQP
jgi:hypothetical protein